jgi:hypothetical protein
MRYACGASQHAVIADRESLFDAPHPGMFVVPSSAIVLKAAFDVGDPSVHDRFKYDETS